MSGSGVDRRGRLEVMPFALQRRKDGTVIISWRGKTVMTLRAPNAATFLARIETLDDGGAQLLKARQTGNFKRGNERGREGSP